MRSCPPIRIPIPTSIAGCIFCPRHLPISMKPYAVRSRSLSGPISGDEIVLTSGATMALDLIARSWAEPRLQPGDEILISIADHHANIVPWQLVAEKTGAIVRAFPLERDGTFVMSHLTNMVTDRTRIIAVPHVSNVLGTVFPIAAISEIAHDAGALLVVDGCQGVVHMPVDVRALGADFYVFSAHKLYGPNGVGVLWGRADILAEMPPFLGGGDMIDRVTIEKTTFAEAPLRFEAGTPAIAETIALGAAIDYVDAIGMDAVRAHEQSVLNYAHQRLSAVEGLTLIGTTPGKSGVVSFTMDCAHPHDISTIIDHEGVAIRAGITVRSRLWIFWTCHPPDGHLSGFTRAPRNLTRWQKRWKRSGAFFG